MGKPRDTKIAILPSTTRKGTTLSTSAALDSPSVISKLVSPPQASNAGTSAESENSSYNCDDASVVLDNDGSLGSFLDATIARSRQIENTETPNENVATPVNSPESVEYSSDDLDEDYVELDDDFIEKCNATTDARKIKKLLAEHAVRYKLSPDPKFATSPININDKDYDFSLDLSHIAIVEKTPFCGTEKESAVEHMIELSTLSSLFSDDVKMRTYFVAKIFPFSLKDDAKTWYNNLPPGSIRSPIDLRDVFFRKYFPASAQHIALQRIYNFDQEDGEKLPEAWARFCSLIRAQPDHDLEKHDLLDIFYSGLTIESRAYLDSCAGCVFRKRTPDDAEELLAKIGRNHDDWSTPEPTPTPILKKRGMIKLNDEDMREAKKSLKEKGIKPEDVKNLPPIEDLCKITPPSSMIEDFEFHRSQTNPMVRYKIYNKTINLPFSDFCAAIRVPQWGSCEKVRGTPRELSNLYTMICNGRSFSDDGENELNAYIERESHRAREGMEEAEEHPDSSSDAASSSYQHYGHVEPPRHSSAQGPYYHSMYDPPAWNSDRGNELHLGQKPKLGGSLYRKGKTSAVGAMERKATTHVGSWLSLSCVPSPAKQVGTSRFRAEAMGNENSAPPAAGAWPDLQHKKRNATAELGRTACGKIKTAADQAASMLMPPPSSKCLYKHKATHQLGGDLLMNMAETAAPLLKWMQNGANEAADETSVPLLKWIKNDPDEAAVKTMVLPPSSENLLKHKATGQLGGTLFSKQTETAKPSLVKRIATAADEASAEAATKLLSPDGTGADVTKGNHTSTGTGFPLSCISTGSCTSSASTQQSPTSALVPVEAPYYHAQGSCISTGSSSCTVYCTCPTVSCISTGSSRGTVYCTCPAVSCISTSSCTSPGSCTCPSQITEKLPKSISKDLNAGRRGKISLVMESEGLTVEGRYSVSPTDGRLAVTSRWKKFIDGAKLRIGSKLKVKIFRCRCDMLVIKFAVV
ncbi:hypothetical protein QYE76_026195 [Lolium multiflorum]|uniref:Retrotransposon gag domain-containing protein n=1 Tax=Lolium multiflorum TaxID=4521 RepID=A0AAD8RFE2_LOLMU|nr:hypothetical protein QYE76_026195 [Lolium multiflorum]